MVRPLDGWNHDDDMAPGMRMALAGVTRDLHKRLHGVFGPETIEALILDGYDDLAPQSTVKDWLVVGAERFTQQRIDAQVQAQDHTPKRIPSVLFLCVHNAGRSQMAPGWLTPSPGVEPSRGQAALSLNQRSTRAVAAMGGDWNRHFATLPQALE